MCFAPNWTLRFFWLVVVGVNSSCAKETKNQQQENIKRWHFKNDIGTVRFPSSGILHFKIVVAMFTKKLS